MSAAEGVRLLTRIGWLAETPADFREQLLGAAVWRTATPGQVFNLAGERDAGIWGVASGQINLTSGLGISDSPMGDVQLPGSWGGFGPLFLGYRGANAEAAMPSLLACVPYPTLSRMLKDHPPWWMFLGRLSASFAFRYGAAAGDLLIPEPRLRLIAVLLRLADCRHRDSDLGLPISIRVTQLQLGRCANVSRQLVGPVLHELEAMRAITVGYREITVRHTEPMRRSLDSTDPQRSRSTSMARKRK